MRHFLSLAAIAVSCCSPWLPAGQAESRDMTLIAGRTLQPDGTLQAGLAVVVREGKVKELIPADDAKDARIRRFGPETVLVPGLIDLFSTTGTGREQLETQPVIDPEANPRDSLAPFDTAFRSAVEAGITTAVIAPAARNLVGGTSLIVRQTFFHRLYPREAEGPLMLAFGNDVWQRDRPPTSRAGTAYELRRLIAAARDGEAHPRLNAVLSGEGNAVVVCPTAADVDAVLGLLGDDASRFHIAHTDDAIEVATELASVRQPVIVGPYGMTAPRRVLMGAAALQRAGVEVAFAGGFPDRSPESLRITAALAVRHGMDAAAARRAMTVAPARVIGLSDQIGAIAPGGDGDLVVFSDDPLRLDARVLEVYLRGDLVYSAANAAGGEQ